MLRILLINDTAKKVGRLKAALTEAGFDGPDGVRAPLVVNQQVRLAKQVVLLNGEYTTSHRVCELP